MWQLGYDSEQRECIINHETGDVLYFLLSAFNHHKNKFDIGTMWDGHIWEEDTPKPNMDIDAGSVLTKGHYYDKFAEIGFNYLGMCEDDGDILDGYEAYEIFHAWCAYPGYNDDPPDKPVPLQVDRITLKWEENLIFYRNGGYRE